MKTARTILATFLVTSAFWLIFIFLMTGDDVAEPVSKDGKVEMAGDKEQVGNVELAESVEVGPAGLAIPVAGKKAADLVDTFTQARAGGARRHDAIDIMADTGTPVVAAAAGTVEKLYFSEGGGGISAYIRSDDGQWIYYYAHLDAYAKGLKEGQAVKRGQRIGTVGSTGNASPDGPHLHFAIHQMAKGEAWHEGTAINPYPLLAGKDVTR